mgnify:CR=1 FL=1|tara:strand:- start:220 stop:999 length:780 start_codon:yes stop_codon:yes gene_type:complete
MVESLILKNKSAQGQLNEKGYVIVSLLQAEDVLNLTNFYNQNNAELPSGLSATAHNPDFAFRAKMSDFIHETVRVKINEKFNNIKMLGGTFMSKTKGESGVLPPHQDWTLVDEKEHASYNLWIPLVDVNQNNGSIQVIDGSHKWKEGVRGPNLHGPFAESTDEMWGKMNTLDMKAGEVLVYDHRLVHSSTENNTDQNRLVVVFGIIPESAEMRIYYLEKNKEVAYHCSLDFFMKNNPHEGPIGLKPIKKASFWKRVMKF